MAARGRPLEIDVGRVIAGRYRVDRVLGEGGMGVVVAATDETSGSRVALKILKAREDEDRERFLREARLAAKLATEHVARIFDVGTLGDWPYMVMERLEGKDYSALRRLKPLSLDQVADCIVQACDALAHAHGAGIVHRDVKLSNLFLHDPPDAAPILKMLDFGVCHVMATARKSDPAEFTLTRTQHAGFLGSPPYMSPEHVRDPRTVDARADLWSLGVVAYRLFSGEYPFAGETSGEVLTAILTGPPAPLRVHGVAVPTEVEAIVLRCLERARDERFPDAGALASAFAPFASPAFRGYGERVREIVRATPANASGEALEGRRDDPSTRSLPRRRAPPPASIDTAPLSSTLRMATTPSPPIVTPSAPSGPSARAVPTSTASRSSTTLVAVLLLVVVAATISVVSYSHRFAARRARGEAAPTAELAAAPPRSGDPAPEAAESAEGATSAPATSAPVKRVPVSAGAPATVKRIGPRRPPPPPVSSRKSEPGPYDTP